MKRLTHRLWLALGFILAPLTLGQVQVNDGRALDNNLQSGSGGLNSYRQRNAAGQLGNAIVTGDVTGLSNFKGTVGYLAPGDFTSNLGSATLYRFRAQTYSAAPIPGGGINYYAGSLPQVGAGTPYAGITTLIRPGAGSLSGDFFSQRYSNFGASPVVRSDDTTSIRLYGEPIARRVVRDPMLGQSEALGTTISPNGGLSQLKASPLTGLTTYNLSTSDTANLSTLAGLSTNNAAAPTVPQLQPQELLQQQLQQQQQLLPGQTPNAAQPAQPEEPEPSVAAPSLVIGQRLNEPISQRVDTRLADQRTAQLRQIDRELFTEQPQAALGQAPDVYQEMLRQIDAQAGSTQTTAKPGQSALEQQIEKTAQAYREAGERAEEKIAKEKAEQAQAGAPKPTATPTPTPRPGPAARAAAEATGNRATTPPANAQLEDLVSKLNYRLPARATLANQSRDQLNTTMLRAEQAMKEGRYFDADEAYSTAQIIRPGYPLARAGQVHAQLGAGLYASAALNLRALLIDHPELIASRYTQPLLPSTVRLTYLQNQLQPMADKAAGDQAALLLAYLAYQQNKPVAEIAQWLDKAQPKAGNDLVPLLRRIWLQPPTGLPATQPARGVGSVGDSGGR